MNTHLVRPTFCTARDEVVPESGSATRIMVSIAFAFAAAFYSSVYYLGAWIISLLR